MNCVLRVVSLLLSVCILLHMCLLLCLLRETIVLRHPLNLLCDRPSRKHRMALVLRVIVRQSLVCTCLGVCSMPYLR